MTISIPLTRGFVTIVDDVDNDLADLGWWTMGDYAGIRTGAMVAANIPTLFLHRVVLERKINRLLIHKEFCDHIDNDKRNNTRDNLRVATAAQNLTNKDRARTATSPYKGVSKHGKKYEPWLAMIQVNNRPIRIGTFKDAIEAHRAYCITALKHHGEFANFGSNSPFKGWTLADFD